MFAYTVESTGSAHHDGILGRDFLRRCLFSYDGLSGDLGISFSPLPPPRRR